ncbi:hypothetical protein FHK92_09485 [Pseudomonas brassicacearum subsp. neoaurantiaca]|uniref:Uncharacterized protein n=1 Tax=Pseudomonas brassicacearum subsp. neoaurantiaca TaxID=494916 RepID=A0A7V8RKA0_9PSED|nr:hypothetical protein [Pseudomonas brassicacearum subsp. neoaurantiaca]
MWRGDLSPLGCAAALKAANLIFWRTELPSLRAASQPSGDKSPRHKKKQVEASYSLRING